jgi:hypothetical protein
MKTTPRKPLKPRICRCGCSERFRPSREWHYYKNKIHRQRAWKKREQRDLWLVGVAEARKIFQTEVDACMARISRRLGSERIGA